MWLKVRDFAQLGSFYDFTQLPDEQQFNLVFKEGEFIDSREIGKNRFALYKLCEFFVELQYNVLQNKLVNKLVFQNFT